MNGQSSIPQIIRAAFPWVHDMQSGEHDLEQLTGDLVTLTPDAFRKYLPIVLLGIWRMEHERPNLLNLGDQVIYTLDGHVSGELNSEALAIRREARRRLFLALNSSQKQAVYYWLKACEGLPFLDYCMPEYESAIHFWRAETNDQLHPELGLPSE